jgi:hypothetical protein
LIRLAAPPKSRTSDRGARRFLEGKALHLERQRALEVSSERKPSRASTHFPCCDSAARATTRRRCAC